jgi:2-polyprenyl-3-methyl-5-hydroxy-6-metoxy-1,4-benzoquinol methylase
MVISCKFETERILMTTPTQNPQPTPERFFQAMNAHQLTEAMKAAINLDLFTAIGEGATTAAEIAKRCSAAERGVRILCDFLVVHEFLTKQGNRYALSRDSAAFLDRRSPMCVASAHKFLTAPLMMSMFQNLADTVRKGGTTTGGEGTLAPEHPIWVEFARSMAPMMVMPAETIARLVDADAGAKWKVLDIAAGHGTFGVTLARHNRNAEIHAVDWPNVLDVAKENAQKAGVNSRYHTIPGDAFKVEFGKDYDVALITNFLHHCDPQAIEAFLRKVHAALKPGGRAVTLEFVPDENRVTPPTAAAFALIMLATTPSGDAYTFPEYDRMFRNAGFASTELHPMIPGSILISKK